MNMPIIPHRIAGSINHIEIAQIVHTEPRNVKLSIERLANKDVIQLPPLTKVENKQSLSPNRFSDAYIFSGEQGKLDSITVVAQLCPQFTALLVKRWYELESQTAKPVELSRMELIQLALAAEQENQALKNHVAVLEPKAQVIACVEGDKVYTQARITAFGLTRLTALVAAAGLLNK